MKRRFSANLGFLWKELPLDERVACAAAAGFTAVEFHDFAPSVAVDQVAEAVRKPNIAVCSLNTSMGSTAGRAARPGDRELARQDIDHAIAVAISVQAKAVHVVAGICDESPMAQKTYRDNLAYACDLAEPNNLKILIEPISTGSIGGYYLNRLEQAVECIQNLDRPTLRLMFDCFHIHGMGLDIKSAFDSCRPFIAHVQIAGIPGRNEPDRGTVDIADLLQHFRAGGYDGWFGCEYVPQTTVEAGLTWMDEIDAR